ncbi:hypothetical protein NPIL_278401 [Nephila pilipes]|uniref:Uncharacterized protein n=1 Tax=Nephila pilipes TaxID=299642 RepID=A0A8X6NQW2_NEPPI|nr:hypothetical protein NPIL_278401 [Nephila pilipes]
MIKSIRKSLLAVESVIDFECLGSRQGTQYFAKWDNTRAITLQPLSGRPRHMVDGESRFLKRIMEANHGDSDGKYVRNAKMHLVAVSA